MPDELNAVRQRIEGLEAAVEEMRERLARCLSVADRPQDAMALSRGVAETLTKRILENIGLKPPAMLDACIRALEKPEVMSRGLVPAEIITLLHMVRVMGNKATHDVMKIEATAADVELVLRSVLRVVEWYFGEFERGPKVSPLFKPGPPPPPLQTDDPPPAAHMPPLTITGTGEQGEPRKLFIFTDRLVGFGRQKTSRDARIHIVARLLPCPDQSHVNWNANLQNISQFHAQLWWEMGRVEIRDENSDKGVLLNGRLIGPGLWTPCSFPDPAHVRLGPQGVEFTVAEILRQVAGVQVPCVRLTRVGNWPLHEYLLVSRPLVTVGSDVGCIAWFPGVRDVVATIVAAEAGWVLTTPDGTEQSIDPGGRWEIGGSNLCVERTTENGFLT